MDTLTNFTFTSILFLLVVLQTFCSNTHSVILRELHVLKSRRIVLECSHESERGNRWEHEGKLLYVGRNQLTTHLNKTTSLLPNYSLAMDPVLIFHEGVYKCIRNSTTARIYNLSVEVEPHIFITINGTENVTDQIFHEDSLIIAECHALRTKPEVTLKWIVDKKDIDPFYSNCKHSADIAFSKTFDCMSTLTIEVRDTKGTLTCTTSGETSFKGKYANVTLHISRDISSRKKWPIVFITVPFFVLFGIGFYYLNTKRAFMDRGLSPIQQPRIIQEDNGFDYESCQISTLTQLEQCTAKGVQETQSADREEENSHLVLENITFGNTLPGDGFFVSCLASVFDNTQIVAKTLSENSPLSDLLIFQDVLNALKSPPKHRNIVEILGTSQTEVPYYFFQEFIENGPLRDYLLRNYQTSNYSKSIPLDGGNTGSGRCDTEELLCFALEIAGGMQFLVDNKFHCPALSVDKILLDSVGVCKLYDFWPETTMKFRIDNLFNKEFPPTAWCAPETVFFRHYTDESDVWSLAIVLWEIYSLGDVPFQELLNEEIETAMRKSHLLERPPNCPEGIFKLMLSAWNTSVKDRPTFHILQKDLSSFRENLSTKDLNLDPLCEIQTTFPEYSSVSKINTLS